MKKLLLIVTAFGMGLSTFAQISTRTNEDVNVPLSARPQAGDMALTFGIDLKSPADSAAGLKVFNALGRGDLLTFKYFLSDNLAVRGGLRLYQTLDKMSGTTLDSTTFNSGWSTGGTTQPWGAAYEFKDSEREYIIVPGIEYHFGTSNIFDVYAGSDLYLGFGKDVLHERAEFKNGDLFDHTAVTKNKIIGLGGIIGFNIFVAQLPISIGLEYGWNAKWKLGNKTKHNEEYFLTLPVGSTPSSVSWDVEYYTTENDPTSTFGVSGNGTVNNGQYKELKRKMFNMDTNNNVRVCLNIYFGTKNNGGSSAQLN